MQNTSLVKMTEVSKTPIFLYFIMSFSSFGRLNRLSMYLSITYTITNIISKTLINVHTFEFFHLDILP